MLGYGAISELGISEADAGATGTPYTLSVDAGTFALTGFDATFALAVSMAVDGGIFALTGFTILPSLAWHLAAAVGLFVLTGRAVGLFGGKILQADTGMFSLRTVSTLLQFFDRGAAELERIRQTASALYQTRVLGPFLSRRRSVSSALQKHRDNDPTLGN